jgi:spermidine synthase
MARSGSGSLPAWAALCFLASGTAGLLYEVVWAKQLAYLMGSSLHAVAAVVASFLGGLALGARCLGVPLARHGNGARMYAFLELGVAVIGLLLLPALRAIDPLVGQLYRALGGETPAFGMARLGLVLVALLPPAALMGATLPVLVAHVERDLVGAGLARLYALNTLGAVAGSLAAGFVLLPGLGLAGTTFVAAAVNLAVAAVAWTAGGGAKVIARAAAGEPEAKGGGAPEAASPALLPAGARRVVAVLFALSGFAALAFQIAWVRLFGLVFGSSVYSFSAVLGVYLLGIALGSALAAPRLPAMATLAGFGALQLTLAAGAALALQAFPGLPERMLELTLQAGGDWRGLLLAESLTVALLIGAPCLLLGALFPVTVRLLQSRDGGHAAGSGYALNTLGTIAGSLAAGFVLVPSLGVHGTHVLATALAALLGLVATAMAWRRRELRAATGLASALSLVVTGVFLALAPRWDAPLMSAGVYRPSQAVKVREFAGGAPDAVRRATFEERVLLYREGINASVILATDPRGRELWLKVGGKVDASSLDMETQVLVGLLPGALADSGARTLVIGHGSGVSTAAALAAGAGPSEVVELEPGVVAASRWFHAQGTDPLDDPRSTLIVGDARTHLLHAAGRYGLVVSQPSNPWIAGVNNLFTVDFYRRVRARLEVDGVYCQWLQLYELSPETFATLLHSFLTVFPQGQVFYIPRNVDLLLVATPPGRGFDLERLRTPAARRLLDRARIPSPEALAAYWAAPFDSLRAIAGSAPLNRDDRPVVEYRAPRDLVTVGRTALGGHPGVVGRIPFTAFRPAGPLFDAWTPEGWYTARGTWLLEQGDAARAARTLAAARAASPEAARALEPLLASADRRARSGVELQHATRLIGQGRREEARAALERAVAVDPANSRAWVILAERRRIDGDLAGSAEAIQHARASGDIETRGDAEIMAGLLAQAKHDSTGALARFTAAQVLVPGNARAYLYEAQVHLTAGNPAAAVAAIRRGLAAAPGSPELTEALARLGERP